MTNGAGVIFYARDTNRHLYLLRNDSKHPNTWGIVGGKCERGESLRDTIERECYEEVGFKFAGHKLFPIECFTTPDGRFQYHTFYTIVDTEFVPQLNHEHIGYCWCDVATYPKPLHPALFGALNYDIIQQKIAIIHDSLK